MSIITGVLSIKFAFGSGIVLIWFGTVTLKPTKCKKFISLKQLNVFKFGDFCWPMFNIT